MADEELVIRISAKTDEFIKKVEDAKTKARSLSMQMAEIDKQLKTESVDRVQKLSEKLELAKRASATAAKEAELYANEIKKLADKHSDLNSLTDKQKEKVLKLSEQMATAQQKAQTYAAEVDKLQKEYNESAEAAKEAEKATESLSDSFDEAEESAESLGKGLKEGSTHAESFFDKLKQGVSINLVTDGLIKIGNLFANIATKAWEAAEKVAAFAVNYAKNAVELAASYEDQVGFAGEVFKDYADKAVGWVEEMSVPLRVSENKLLEYLNRLGNMLTSYGLSEEEAANRTEEYIQMAVDLRAATGDDLSLTMNALTSAVRESYQPMQRYGVIISKASIEATALSKGLVTVTRNEREVRKAAINVTEARQKETAALQKYGEESLEYKKAQIAAEEAEEALSKALNGQTVALTQVQQQEALKIILDEALKNVSGQAAREADSYSSQLALQSTLFENLQKKIGEKLLPAFNTFLTKFNEFIQSDEGKEFLDGIVESVGTLANKVMEIVENGKLEEWFNAAKEKLPEITESIINFSQEVTELIPQVFELTEKILSLFGIKTENEKIKEAFLEVKEQIKQFATNSGTDIDTMINAIHAYAEAHEIDLVSIYSNWEEYQPKISAYIQQISTDVDGTKIDLNTALGEMTNSTQTNVETQITFWDRLVQKIQGVWEFLKTFFSSDAWDKAFTASDGSKWDFGNKIGRFGFGAPHAKGGPVLPGQVYRVNDDHGLRQEMFIPSVPGYILDGNRTQSVVNNNSSTSNSYGNINVYVNSYGADAASIADEIGQAVNQRLRMAGAW